MDEQKVVLTVTEAGKRLGLSRPSAYQAVKCGEIPSLRIGKRILVPVVGLERLLASAAGTSESKNPG